MGLLFNGHSVLVEYDELVEGGLPVPDRTLPLLQRFAQAQVEQLAYPLMSEAASLHSLQRCAALSRYVPLNVSGNATGTLIGSKPLPSRQGHMEAYNGIRDVPPVARLRAVSGVFRGRETVSLHVGSVSGPSSCAICASLGKRLGYVDLIA